MAAHPEYFPQTKNRRGRGGRRADLDDRYFRSAWEANYARYLNLLVRQRGILRWEYEVDTFEFPVKRGCRFYTPDFKVWTDATTYRYHEVKGYMDQKSATKLKRMKKYHPEQRIVLIDSKTYHAIAASVSRVIPHWEQRR